MMNVIALIGIISMFIAGCSNQEQSVEVQKRIGDENNYEDFKLITNHQQVQKIREIIDNIDWETAKVQMARPADYRFAFQFKNEAKAVLYELWISPNKDKVELIIDAGNKYVQLDRNTSAELFKVLIGEKLSDQK
ncbi:hypothetical protein [Fredinandcohnia onubensis]|uniref:hypothetical protein n=1 Tax=Fredinandcohnia onubensis TaxID=1571209 RepID=UPI000C0BF12E|nr:hypothetical protein [Fredinandcohnia onubensis]